MLKGNNKKIKRDLFLIAASVGITAHAWSNGYIEDFLNILPLSHFLSALIAGIFFTSAFTTIPAIALLVKMAQLTSTPTVAFFGAIGAVLGDGVIFYFFRDSLVKDIANIIKKRKLARIQHILKSKIIRFSVIISSGVLIALPLPTDEAAFFILSLTKTKTPAFLIIAFTFNFLAIYTLSRITGNFLI